MNKTGSSYFLKINDVNEGQLRSSKKSKVTKKRVKRDRGGKPKRKETIASTSIHLHTSKRRAGLSATYEGA